MAYSGRGVRLCFADVYATWTQIAFCAIFIVALALVVVDLLTTEYTLDATESVLTWLNDKDLPTFLLIFYVFGAVAILLLLPQTVLFLGAGYSCDERIDDAYLAYVVALTLSLVTFVTGATVAFLLARKVLPPACTRNFVRHFPILNGLDHALQHKGRKINILLRVNPVTPYNALNYGLGLSQSTLSAYVQGMVGAVPFTCVAVYAGMIISSVDDIDSVFSQTSTAWYCIYGVLACVGIVSFFLVVRYTKAEMDAALGGLGSPASSARESRDLSQAEGDGDSPGASATLFGTFTTDDRLDWGHVDGTRGEEMTTFEDSAMSRQPLLGVDDRRKSANLSERSSLSSSSLARSQNSLVDI